MRLLLLQEGSEQLLRETAEAQRAGLDFGAVRDLRPLLDAEDGGNGVLHPFLLHAVAGTLDAAAALHQRVEQLAAVGPRELVAGPESMQNLCSCQDVVLQTCLRHGARFWRCMCLALTSSHTPVRKMSRLPCTAAQAHGSAQSCGRTPGSATSLASAVTSVPDRWQAATSAQDAGEPGSALRALAAGIGDALPGLRAGIWRCIHPEEARLVDTASAALAEVRAARGANRSELRATLDGWARAMLGRGASERAQARRTLAQG